MNEKTIFRNDRKRNNKGGVACYISNHIAKKTTKINKLCFNSIDIETLTLMIQGKNNSKTAIITVYRPPGHRHTTFF